jgi:hypothetical protein
MHGAIYVSNSDNSKLLGSKPVDTTYASIKATCPDTCSLKGNGCYAQAGSVNIHVRRLDKRARQHSPLRLARAEAEAINTSYHGGVVPAGRFLRLHISGDSRTIKGTRLINKAVGKWKKRGGSDVWNYTHAWSHVPRKEWSNVSVLASVENVKEAEQARACGYAAALVVAEHPSEKAYTLPGSDIKWIPCVQQTKGIGCSDCRLCFNADRLYKDGYGIAFAAHGSKKNSLKRRLTVLT